MIRVQTLGTATIEAGRNRLTPASVRKFALLLHLAAEPGRRISRATLRELIFPDKTEKSAAHSLRELVYQFRHSGIPLTAELDGVELDPNAVSSDYAEIVRGGSPSAEQLRAAAGGFLPGYAPHHSEAFSEWLDGYRAQTTFEVCRALLKEVARSRSLGDWQTTERAARACLALDALNEEATLALAEVLAIGGSKAQAVRLLDTYMHELGDSSRDLRVSAAVLRRRIGEKLPSTYATRLASPFVGRGPQMLELRARLDIAKTGDSQCVALLGEAGIGKTRLASEFCSIAALEGAGIAMTDCRPSDGHRPFSAFADLVPTLREMRGALGCSPVSLMAIERLTNPSGESVPFEDSIRNSEALCDSIAYALVDLVDAVASEQPLVLAIEDIHCLDSMSTRVIAGLLSRRRPRRVLVLLTSREASAIHAISRYAESVLVLNVCGLEAEAIERMASALAIQNELHFDNEIQRWLESTSTGNPLFLESLVSHYVTTRERFAISPTLLRLLGSRIRLLHPAAITTLQTCALLGKHSTLDTIIQATELPRFELLRAVSELEEARMVVSSDESVRVAHALIAEVALSTLTPIQSRLAHRCVAEALDSSAPIDGAASIEWDCAEHWIAANDSKRAAVSLRRCATHALEAGRPGDAAEAFSRALALGLKAVDRNEIARAMAVAADAAGDPALSFRALNSAELEPDCGMHDDFEFVRFRAFSRSMLAEQKHAERLLNCVQEQRATPNHRVIAATLALKFGDMNGDKSWAPRVSSLDSDTIAAADEPVRFEFLMVRAIVGGNWEEASDMAHKLVAAAEALPIPLRLFSLANAAVAFSRSGSAADAVAVTTRIYEAAVQAGMLRMSARAAAYLAETCVDARDDVRAADWLGRMSRVFEVPPDIAEDVVITMAALHGACTLGNLAEAHRLYDRAQRVGLFSGSALRARQEQLASLWIRQLSGADVATDTEIESLLGNALNTNSACGVRDAEMAVACRALLNVGRAIEARDHLQRYISHARPDRSVLARCLQDVQDALVVDD